MAKIYTRRTLKDELRRLERQYRNLLTMSDEAYQQAGITLSDNMAAMRTVNQALEYYTKIEKLCENITLTSPSVQYGTPDWFLDRVRLVIPTIDLDVASCLEANLRVKAGSYYTAEMDGLSQNWYGNVFCNPPYGNQTRLFMEKAIKEYKESFMPACIFLVNRTGAKWYRELRRHFSVCELHERVAFHQLPGGTLATAPRYYNDVLLLAHSDTIYARFREVFSDIGDFRLT